MAFDNAYLVPIGGVSGKAGGVYRYDSLDACATQDSADYFNGGVAYGGAYNKLRIGDIIFSVDWTTAVGEGGTIADFGIFIVNAKASGTLDVTSVVDLLSTDAD